MTSILVTGARGTIGRRVLDGLVTRGLEPVALVRSPSSAPDLPTAVRPVVGDYADRGSVDAAMRGIDAVFLVCSNGPAQVEYESTVIASAAAAGVGRIVKVSAHGADPDSTVAFWRQHAEIEARLAASGIAHVALRPTFAMANVLGYAREVADLGILPAPDLIAPVAMIHPDDVAAVACRFLTAEGPLSDRGPVELTGPAGVTFSDLAAGLSPVAGRTVTYRPLSDSEVAGFLEPRGVPSFVVEQILAIFAVLRSGAQSHPTSTVARILGRPPRDLAAFLTEHAEAFRATSVEQRAG